MDKSILELLEEVSGADLLFAIFLVFAICVLIFTQKEKLSKYLNKWRKTKNEEEDFRSLVYTLKDSIEELSKEVKQNQKNRDAELLKYRDDSRVIREEIYKVLNGQSADIKDLAKSVKEMQEKDSKTRRAELKEKIEKLYSECHPHMKCTDMQLEVLKELIEEYEEHGGINSFVHSTVEKEMYQWEIISQIKE